MNKQRTYFCIDMKSFYASVECAERGLNPFETNLVVADPSRGRGALCLAVSPKLKAQGIGGRARLYEIPKNITYIAALPQMKLYVEYAADIYEMYLDYFDPADIHVYSIDESFIDVTDYLDLYHMSAKELAKKLMDEIASRFHIPSTAGIGTNLFLAKVALDITAKHAPDHMGVLTEETFRQTLWDHKPITDFWHIAKGTQKRLNKLGIQTMRGITQMPQEILYKEFGIDAELLIDHAWGRETCLMEDIKNYRSKNHSVSFSQILPYDYSFERARVVMREMILNGCHELMKRGVISKKVWIGIMYTHNALPAAHGHVNLMDATALYSLMEARVMELYDRIADRKVLIRRMSISFEDVCDEGCEGYGLFSDWHALEREKAREKAVLELSERYGKNTILRGTDFLDGATQRERNEMIGGHKA